MSASLIVANEVGTTHVVKNTGMFVNSPDWIEVADATWQHTMTIGWGGAMNVAVDDPENQIPKSNSPTLGQWGNEGGVITVMSELKPDVYYSRVSDTCVVVRESADITVSLTGRLAAYGVRVEDSTNVRVIIEGHNFGSGIYCRDSSMIVEDFHLNNLGGSAVSFQGNCNDSKVERGYADMCGKTSSSGTVYAGATQGIVTVKNVIASRQQYGNFWEWDGSAFYADNGSKNIHFINNTAIDCKRAMHDNSGNFNLYANTKIINCEETVLKVSDVHSFKQGIPVEMGTVIVQ